MRTAAQIAIPVIAPRAVVVWALSRLVYAAVPMATGQDFGSVSPSPIAVVLLAGLIGLIDVNVRSERILWANLGVKPIVLYGVYAAAAVPGELLLTLVR